MWHYKGLTTVVLRSFILSGLIVLGSLILIARLFQLQVVESEKYTTMADKNRIDLRLLTPARGKIFDRNGDIIASYRKGFRVLIVPEKSGKDFDLVLNKIDQILSLSDGDKKRIKRDLKQNNVFTPIIVSNDIPFEKMAQIQINLPSLPGVMIHEVMMRLYPLREVNYHPIGYVSSISKDDYEADIDLSRVPDLRIGKVGFEKTYNELLLGVPGVQKMEINASGRDVRQLDIQESVSGHDIEITLDNRYQKIAYDALKGQSGSAVMIEIKTGADRVMVSNPGIGGEIFNAPIDEKTWSNIMNNKFNPMLNKAIGGLYSPGSIFKIVVALAGLEAGVIHSDKDVYCEGHTDVGTHRFHDWKKGGHGHINLTEALQYSCDVYFYEIAKQIPPEKIIEVAERLGVGQKTGIDLISEQSGLLPDNAWKRKKIGENWRLGDTVNLSIGQGYLLMTPLQMAYLTALFVSNGQTNPPYLYRSSINSKKKSPLFNNKHLDAVKKGLNAVVNKEGGTAYHSRINVNGIKMAGKTASTQTRRISLSERESGIKKQSELPWEFRDHAFFVAYAPVKNPKYALAVAVERGGSGGSVAAPIAGQILQKVFEIEENENGIISGS